MLKTYTLSALFCLWGIVLGAQVKETIIAPTKTPLEQVDQLIMPEVDNGRLLEEEMARRRPGVAPQFAKAFEVDVSPWSQGTWETLADGRAVWRLRILSKNAYSLNLGFSSYYMPKGGQLILYSPDRQRIMGPFTKSDNEDHAQLWTPIFQGDDLVLEVSLPARLKSALQLRLIAVNHDFLNFSKMNTSIASGSCNLDVVCSEEDGWEINDLYREAIQSVGIYGFNGTNFCTGFLINNALNDCTPYFMTAYHCGVTSNNAPSVVVYWNYQNTTCRQPRTSSSGAPGNGLLRSQSTGASLVATYKNSDFTLLRLDDEVPESADAYFAGWNRDPIPPTDTVFCVHHPNSEEKRISYSFQDTYLGEWASEDDPVPDGDHVVVPRWDIGTTEVGSSGGPLFNNKGQVVGQLHGGFADCNNFFYDSFGAFSVSWAGGRSDFSRLSTYLDPEGTNIMELGGRLQQVCSYTITPKEVVQSICLPDTAIFTFQISDQFTSPIQLSIEGLRPAMQAEFAQNPVFAGQEVELRIVADDTIASGNYALNLLGQSADGVVSSEFFLQISSGLPIQSQLIAPADKLGDAPNIVNFEWTDQDAFITYHLQISLDSLFTELEADIDFLDTTILQYQVAPEQKYFWRVRAENICGNSEWSAIRTFQTADVVCDLRSADNLPITISSEGTSKISSVISFDQPGQVISLSILDLNIDHTFIGDLSASLVTPSGRTLRLFDRIGSPEIIFGCDGDNIRISLFDDANRTAEQLENICGTNPAVVGNFQPIDAFSNLVGEPVAGDWTLVVEDFSNQDGGELKNWELDICTTQPKGVSISSSTEGIESCINQPINFNITIGAGFDSTGVSLSYVGLPDSATLRFSENPAMPGSTITISVEGLTTPGEYPLEIIASDPEFVFTKAIPIQIVNPPDLPMLQKPSSNELLLTATPALEWNSSAYARMYKLEIATDEQFTDTVLTITLEEYTFTVQERLSPGVYYWRVTAINACGASTTAASTFDISTTGTEATTVPQLKVYPNPTRNQVTLDFGPDFLEDIQWQVRSPNGQVMLSGFQTISNIHTIDLGAVPSGLYLLEIRSTRYSVVKKIIKK
jgi:subtilisin-like proprotein convertase family protein